MDFENVSDLYKDVYGFRPKHDYGWGSMSRAEKEAEWERLSIMLQENIRDEEVARRRAVSEFYDTVVATQVLCSCPENDAIRIMAQGAEVDMNHKLSFEAWLYSEGILFTREGSELLKDFDEGRFS